MSFPIDPIRNILPYLTSTAVSPILAQQQLLNLLNSAVNSGNLQAAQNAYSNFQKSLNPNTTPEALSSAFTQIGLALQSGDLPRAQEALQEYRVQREQHQPHEQEYSQHEQSQQQSQDEPSQDDDDDNNESGGIIDVKV